MKRTKLLQTTPRDIPEIESEDVMAASQIVEVDGKQTLCIDLFYMGSLKGRYFADETVFNSWVGGSWTTNRLNNVVRMCKEKEPVKGEYYYCSGEYEWVSEEDKQRALDFLDTWSMNSYEESINQRKRETAIQRKMERIDKEMGRVPCVPDEAEKWVEEKIFPGHFLYMKKTDKRITYNCTACGASGWRKTSWKHGEMTICPKCGAQVKVNSRRQETCKKASVIILQAYDDQWVERQFKATCRWGEGKKEIRLLEQCRATMPRGETWGKVWYGTIDEADEFEQEYWDKNPLNRRFVSSYLYPGNLKEVLPYGNLQQSGLMEIANSHIKINVNKYITTFHLRPWVEYLVKAGLTNMVADIMEEYGWWGNPSSINTDGKNLREALNMDGNRVSRIKQINGGIQVLEWLQYEEKTGIKISRESLEFLQKKKVSMEYCREILQEVGSVNRMVNYMKKQRIAPNNLAHIWRDYLNMARSEGLNTEDDIVRLPKDLKARHDQLVEVINARADAKRKEEELRKYKKLDDQIREHLPEVKRYFWEDDTYMIIPAGKCGELVEEGRTLHHCVASSDIYMNRMAAGTSWILFLRKKEALQKPYYTIEIDMKDDRILQYYSEFDRQPDKSQISKLLNKFKSSIKRQQTPVRVQVAAIA